MQRGFTLIELIAVLVIVAALAALAVPRLSPGDTTVNAQADALAGDLRHAQALAMSQGRALDFEILSPTSYRIAAAGTTLRDPAGELLAFSLQNGVTVAGGTVRFDSLGRPLAGGNLIGAAQTWTLSAASRSASVSLQPVTGFVTVTP